MSPNLRARPADIHFEVAVPGEDPFVTRCSTSSSAFLNEAERSGVTPVDLPRGRAVAYSARSPGKSSPNEDSVLVTAMDDGLVVLAVADGCGGFAAGNIASRVALEAVAARFDAAAEGEELTATVLAAFTARTARCWTWVSGRARRCRS